MLDGPEGPGQQLSEIKDEVQCRDRTAGRCTHYHGCIWCFELDIEFSGWQASFRASRFPASAKGNLNLLSITKPDAVAQWHLRISPRRAGGLKLLIEIPRIVCVLAPLPSQVLGAHRALLKAGADIIRTQEDITAEELRQPRAPESLLKARVRMRTNTFYGDALCQKFYGTEVHDNLEITYIYIYIYIIYRYK